MNKNGKRALIVGASRGLGLGLVRGYLERDWQVVATSRGHDDALRALASEAPDRLQIEPLDVTDAAGVATLRDRLGVPDLDVLFVVAGVMNQAADKPGGLEAPEEFARVLATNALAPMALIEALGDSVAPDGAIVAMTSILGSVDGNGGGGYDVYRASKAALNTMLRCYASRHAKRTVIAMHPGWVRTDMGGSRAALSVEESVAGMIDVVADRSGRPGCLFVDHRGATIPW